MTVWTEAASRLIPGETVESATGRLFVVLSFDEKRAILERPDTGSRVTVSRGKVEKAAERLLAGESVPFRSISYTVAIETGVCLALGPVCQRDASAKVYRCPDEIVAAAQGAV